MSSSRCFRRGDRRTIKEFLAARGAHEPSANAPTHEGAFAEGTSEPTSSLSITGVKTESAINEPKLPSTKLGCD